MLVIFSAPSLALFSSYSSSHSEPWLQLPHMWKIPKFISLTQLLLLSDNTFISKQTSPPPCPTSISNPTYPQWPLSPTLPQPRSSLCSRTQLIAPLCTQLLKSENLHFPWHNFSPLSPTSHQPPHSVNSADLRILKVLLYTLPDNVLVWALSLYHPNDCNSFFTCLPAWKTLPFSLLPEQFL